MKKQFSTFLFVILAIILTRAGMAQTFDCNSNLYQVVNGTDLKVLDPATGTYQLIGSSSLGYNGAGFNTEDNYIYGIGSGNVLVRIDNTGSHTELGAINNLRARSYSADIDTLGNWFSFDKINGNWIFNKIDVSVLPPVVEELQVTELSGVSNAKASNDIVFNPVTQKYYGMSAGSITEFDPYNLTVKGLGNYSEFSASGGYGAAWSDNSGNSYFFNNGTGNIYRAQFDATGNILSFAYISTSEPNANNDGMSCSLAAPPAFPENCTNGIDDDLDGLIDCEDPDCTATEDCGISGVAFSSDYACSESIATYHAFFTNNSALSNTITVTEVLPSGFIYVQDTIEFDAGGTNQGTFQPVDGDVGTLKWGPFTLQGGETVRISYDVALTGTITNGVNTNHITAELTAADTHFFPAVLTSNVTVGDCPTPNTYSCEPAFYQVYRKRGKNQPNMYGKLNPITGDYDPIVVASDYANGLGFDINTGLVYGATGKRFVQLDEDGLTIDKDIRFNHNVFRGDINESSQWYGVDGSDMVVIDVSGVPEVENRYVGEGLPGWDIAYNIDGNFYSVHHNNLYRFDTSTNQKSTLGVISGNDIPVNGGYGAQWTGSDGHLYISHNSTGKIIRVDIETLEARVVSSSIAELSKNDGFSCPSQIPAVFEFDYGDNSHLPQCRILTYHQDLSNDEVPDYSTFWIGNTVNYDSSDPSNANADGDLDDGFQMDTEIQNGTLSTSMGLNANHEGWAYHLIGLDWDDNGLFDEVQVDSTYLTGAQTILGSLDIPVEFSEGLVNVRIVVSEERLTAENISGDLTAMGEVEDYRFNVTAPCEGCSVSGGDDGGLESDGSLAGAISKRNFLRRKNNHQGGLKINQARFDHQKRANHHKSSYHLESFFPETGIYGNEEARVSSPTDLVHLTNAQDVFSLDYYQADKRVAVSLLLTTENNVYNHTKNICDRLNGRGIAARSLLNIDGVRIIYAKIIDEHAGVEEYAAWFSVKDTASHFEVLSQWAVDEYPEGDYLNFQVWANTPTQIVYLSQYILNQLKLEKPLTSPETLPKLPKVFVKSGYYANGELRLSLINLAGPKQLVINSSSRSTEFSDFEDQSFEYSLSGEKEQALTLPIGYVFDAGLSIWGQDEEIGDALYLADGAWGVDFNADHSSVDRFEIKEVDLEASDDNLLIERGFELEAYSKDVINVFKNLKAGNSSMNLSDFNTLGFYVQNDHPLEVVLLQKDLEDWEKRSRVTIPVHDAKTLVTLKLDQFNQGVSDVLSAVDALIFSYINQSGSREHMTTQVTDIFFYNEMDQILSVQEEVEAFTAYPNPSMGTLNVQFQGSAESTFRITVIDQSARTLYRQSGTSQPGLNQVQLNLQHLETGLYFLKLYKDDKEHLQRILIRP